MKLSREWAMPNPCTFSMKPVANFIQRWMPEGALSVDPFARDCRLASVTNDMNTATAADFHLDAEDFLATMAAKGRLFDVVLFDPPYSPRQMSECYKSMGLAEMGMKGTQNAALYKRVRDRIPAILKPGGAVLSFGWSTNGMGKGRGFKIEEILLVAHGGAHNDTICMTETAV